MPKYISQLARMLEEAGLDPEKMLDAYADPVKAYKLFRMKDDELYPLFVNADKPVLMDEWLPAEAGALAPSGKVKSKIGDLAYRPGWHAGEYPLATHIGGKATERGVRPKKPNYRPDDQVWAEIEMPNMVNWQQVANDRMEFSKAGKPIPRTAHITDQVPYGGHYRYKTNPNMTGDWLIGGDMKVNRILDDKEVRELNRASGVEDLPRLRNLQKRKGYVPAAAAGAVGLGALGESEESEAGVARPLIERLDRAFKQGFDIDNPVFHGTGSGRSFDEFEPGRMGSTFFAENEDLASQFGVPEPYYLRKGNMMDIAGDPAMRQKMLDMHNEGGGWQQLAEEAGGYSSPEEYWADAGGNRADPSSYRSTLEDQDWEILDDPENDVWGELGEEYDSFRFNDNDNTPAISVSDPTRIRSVDAEFRDPTSKNVMASAAGGAAGLGALADTEQAQAYDYGTGAPGAPYRDPEAWMYERPALMEGPLGELPESVQAGILAAGKETDKLVTGARDLFGDLLGIDEEWRGENQKRQRDNDRIFAPVEDEYTAATMIGSMAPYLATGALYGTLGPMGAGLTAAGEGALYYQEDPEDRLVNAALGGGLGYGVGKGLQKWGDRVSQNPWRRGR